MSTSSLTSLAVARDFRAPTKSDIGKALPEQTVTKPGESTTPPEKPPSIPDMLVTLLPTGIVTSYSALVTIVVGILPDPTREDLHPPEYLLPRFLVLGLMVAFVAGWTWRDYVTKSAGTGGTRRRTPWPEIAGAAVIAAGWGLATPGSPLADAVDSGFNEVFWPLVAGFMALGIAGWISVKLRTKAA